MPAVDVPREMLAQPEYRVEGPLKVTGAARYTADVRLPGMLHLAYTRSPMPHARIVSIDTRAATAVPGVHAVLTGADIGFVGLGRQLQDWPALAIDRVRMIGDRVAAVAAESKAAADEAARLVEVEYEELPLVTLANALDPDAPILHPDPDTYAFLGFIEPRACVVWIDEDDRVHVTNTNKAPAQFRRQLASGLGIEADRIVVDTMFIGGDFGGKGLSIDEYACYHLAKVTGRPIKAVMSYLDEMQASNARHPAILELRTAVDRDGRFLAHQSDVVIDGGAYAAGKAGAGLIVPAHQTLTAYRIPVTRLEGRAVYTNSIPGGSMRAPGDPQSMFAGESHVDMIAGALGIDPIELR